VFCTVRATPGRLRALSVPHSECYFVWRICVGARGAQRPKNGGFRPGRAVPLPDAQQRRVVPAAARHRRHARRGQSPAVTSLILSTTLYIFYEDVNIAIHVTII
jgi:hypothetical protein